MWWEDFKLNRQFSSTRIFRTFCVGKKGERISSLCVRIKIIKQCVNFARRDNKYSHKVAQKRFFVFISFFFIQYFFCIANGNTQKRPFLLKTLRKRNSEKFHFFSNKKWTKNAKLLIFLSKFFILELFFIVFLAEISWETFAAWIHIDNVFMSRCFAEICIYLNFFHKNEPFFLDKCEKFCENFHTQTRHINNTQKWGKETCSICGMLSDDEDDESQKILLEWKFDYNLIFVVEGLTQHLSYLTRIEKWLQKLDVNFSYVNPSSSSFFLLLGSLFCGRKLSGNL